MGGVSAVGSRGSLFRRRTLGLTISAVSITVAVAFVAVEPAMVEAMPMPRPVTPATPGSFEFVDLGVDTYAYKVGETGEVLAWRYASSVDRRIIFTVWDDGSFTTLAGPGGVPNNGQTSFGYPSDINPDGVIVGSAGDGTYVHPARWSVSGRTLGPVDVGVLSPNATDYGTAQYTNADGDVLAYSNVDGSGSRVFLSENGTGPKQIVGSALGLGNESIMPCGLADDGRILIKRGDRQWLVDGPAGAGTELESIFGFGCTNGTISYDRPMASDGTIVGYRTVIGGFDLALRSPDGTVTTDPGQALTPRAVNADAVVVGSIISSQQRAAMWVDGQVTDLTALFPSGWLTSQALDVNDNGDIVGYVVDATGGTHGFLLKAKRSSITGSVTRGSAPGKPFTPKQPVRNVEVRVAGTATGGAAFSGKGTTNAAGVYTIAAPPGRYTLTFPNGACANTTGACARTAQVTVPESGSVTRNAVVVSGRLDVAVRLSKKNLTLERNDKGDTKPEKVTVTVVVTNTGSKPVSAVTQPAKLSIAYAKAVTPAVDKVPVTQTAGPTPKARIGTLNPGKTARITYTVTASGDGKYDIEALVIGSDALGRIVGLDTETLTVGAPVLVMSLSMGKKVPSPEAPRLAKAGTAFTINVTMENRSFVTPIVVAPLEVTCRGNANDCHLQLRDLPIQNVRRMPEPSPWVVLDARQTREFEIVVRTTNVAAAVMLRDEVVGGGTRASVEIAEPKAWAFVDGDKGAAVKPNQIFVDGKASYEVGLDVRDFVENPEPETVGGYAVYITKGVFDGLWNITAGAVSGIFIGLPRVIGKTYDSVPAAAAAFVQTEVELWGAIKDDPVKRSLFLNILTHQTLLAYEAAPGLVRDAEALEDKISAAVLAQYTEMWNAWYAGDWRTAVTAFSTEGTERAVDVATALAPGVLARFPGAVEAFKAQKAALYAGVTEDLAAYGGKFFSAREAMAILSETVKVGYEMTDVNLRRLYGLTLDEATFLRRYAQANDLLIVVRSRAAESVRWLKSGLAVLKPESIKIKNVAPLDAKYLGFRESDVGRVVLRTELPSEAEVIARLRRDGFGPGSPEYVDTLKRLETRREELTKTKDGYFRWMQDAAAEGKVRMKWNFLENSVDAQHYTDTVITYDFQLRSEGGNLIPEFKVGGRWRSITGDVDFLQIAKGNGRPLTDAQRVKVYKDMANSVVGMLHPESATWTDIKSNLFNFETKVNEFVRGGTVAQFAPDGKVRAVTFNKMSKFSGKYTYRIQWNGGYVAVGGRAP